MSKLVGDRKSAPGCHCSFLDKNDTTIAHARDHRLATLQTLVLNLQTDVIGNSLNVQIGRLDDAE
jgi:hypothetical protein